MIKCKNSCPIDKFEGCCFECDLKKTCIEICGMNPSKCGDSIMDEVSDIVTAKKKLEEQEKELKENMQV